METNLYKIAEDLAGRPVNQLIPCRNGRNSQVYKVECADINFALKSYPPKNADPRDRFGTEIKTLKFYEANNNPYVPRLIAVDMQRSIALLEWIEGSLINTPSTNEIDQAVNFIALTHHSQNKGGDAFGLAAEPCLSGADLDQHLNQRLKNIFLIAEHEPELNNFLLNELSVTLRTARSFAFNESFHIPLPRQHQSLIPADFGFHNALKIANGNVYFIDFEYFGWDDPVRLAADFLLHPGVSLDENSQNRFWCGMVDIFHSDNEFKQRMLQLAPLYGVRWVLILLNEFLPERWQARVFAGETASWHTIKEQQLVKARVALDKVKACLKFS